MVQDTSRSSRRIRVLIAHEVRVVRESIASFLRQCPDLTVIALPQPETGYKKPKDTLNIDVVLTIAELSDDAVAEQIQRIKEAFPGTKVVMIGVSGTASEYLGCIEAGTSGYVLPESPMENLVETVQMVHRGEASCPPDILALLFERTASLRSQLQTVQDIELSSLTQRELGVLQLVADGMSNKEIALHLSLELQTVKNHVHNILEKLRVHNRREAVACSRRLSPVTDRS
jgi:two-component system nitrate/nitrite response regulator NarL